MGIEKSCRRIIELLSLVLFVGATSSAMGQEYLAPLLYNGTLQSKLSSEVTLATEETKNTFDSTFVYTIDTLDIKHVFDDFSSDKFVDYNVPFTNPNVTSTLYHHILDETGSNQLPPNTVLCDSSHARRDTVFIVSGDATTKSYYFPEVKVQINNLENYPVISQPRILFAECFVTIDTVIDGILNTTSDTIFYTGAPNQEPDFVQDSARIFFAIMDDTNKIWVDKFACRNFGLAKNPWSLGVVSFDGVDETGYPYTFGNKSAEGIADYLTSKPINLGGLANVYLDFIFQAQGNCDAPELNDSLVLQFYFPDQDKWLTPTWAEAGEKPSDLWDTAHVAVPSFLWVDGFRFRFYNKANTSGWLDHWHVDYVRLRANQLPNDPVNFNDLAVSEPPHTLLKDFTQVPWDHFRNANPADKMLDEIELNVYNCDNTPSGQIPGAFQVDFQGAVNGGPYSLGVTSSWNVGITPYPIPISSNYTFDNNITTDPKCTYDIKLNIATDGSIDSKNSVPDNDTVRFQQVFKNYYAYDDGSAELAYGVTGNRSQLAYKFDSYEADTLTGILMSFMPTVEDLSSNIFLLTIWAADGNGNPGEIIYQDDFFNPHYPEYRRDKNAFVYYTFINNEAVVVPKTFFVGWDQIEDQRLNIGIDMNIPNNDKIFFNTTGTWNTSNFEGSLLIRPVFSTALNYTLSNPSEETEQPNILAYPNPTSGLLNLKGIDGFNTTIKLFDLSGKLVIEDFSVTTIDIADLKSGLYILEIRDEENKLITTQKITKQ